MQHVFGKDGCLALIGDRGSREGRFFFKNPICEPLAVVSGFLKGGLPFLLCLPALSLVEETDGVVKELLPIF
jgi:hypothetical protein